MCAHKADPGSKYSGNSKFFKSRKKKEGGKKRAKVFLLGEIPALQLPAATLRETLAASRPARPSCLCLSCSTATLTAVFPLISDGTSLRLATSSLQHHLFLSPLRHKQPNRLPRRRRRRDSHLETMRRERTVISGFQAAESTLLLAAAKVRLPSLLVPLTSPATSPRLSDM